MALFMEVPIEAENSICSISNASKSINIRMNYNSKPLGHVDDSYKIQKIIILKVKQNLAIIG